MGSYRIRGLWPGHLCRLPERYKDLYVPGADTEQCARGRCAEARCCGTGLTGVAGIGLYGTAREQHVAQEGGLAWVGYGDRFRCPPQSLHLERKRGKRTRPGTECRLRPYLELHAREGAVGYPQTKARTFGIW